MVCTCSHRYLPVKTLGRLTIGQEGDLVVLAHGLQLTLELSAMDQVVVWLQAVKTQGVANLGLPEGLDKESAKRDSWMCPLGGSSLRVARHRGLRASRR